MRTLSLATDAGVAALRRRQAAFTLLELLVVMAILVMTYALVPRVYSGLVPAREFDAAAHDLLRELRSLRQSAVVEGRTLAFTVENDGTGYRAGSEAPIRTLPRATSLQLEQDPDRVIRFFADGKNDGFVLRLSGAGGQVTISSDWVTGRLVVSER